jgi:hypothetical protein
MEDDHMADERTSEADPDPVGYRRPPAGTRFRKGQSGNPAGKPKGSKNKPRPYAERLGSLMLEEAYRPITVSEDGKEITLPLAQAVFRSLAAAAAKGEARAQAMFLKLISASEGEAAMVEEMIDEASEEAAHQPRKIVREIVDAVDGRPTGKTELLYSDDVQAKGGKNPPAR